MSFYQALARIGERLGNKHVLFKHGFNLSPMYRRSTGRVLSVSPDLLKISVRLPISYKNRNYVGSIFGGSMFSAVDPMPMVQLINLLGADYVVWDKSAEIFFKIPAREDLYADFEYTLEEIDSIRQRVQEHSEIEIVKTTQLSNATRDKVYCEVHKRLYIASKAHFKAKRQQRSAATSPPAA